MPFVPVWPTASRAATVSVCVPSDTTVAPGVGCVIHTCRPPPEMVNVRPFDVPPPDGFITVTVAEPAAATSLAPMLAVSWVALTNVVARAAPFHCTVEPATKFVPFTVSVNAPLPAATLVGDIELKAGGFGGGGAAPPPI